MMIRGFCVGALACAMAASFVGTAHAGVLPIAVKSVIPADGTTIAPSQSVTFQIKSDDPIQSAHVEVATQPTLGQDGTLAQEFTLPEASYLTMTKGDAFPDTYTVASYGYSGSWSTRPGTYYWQVSYTSVDQAPPPTYSQINTHTSPVYRLVIQAPASAPTTPPAPATGTPPSPSTPSMTLAQANSYTRIAIRDKTGHSAYHLKRRCKRTATATATFDCDVTWSTTSALRRSTLIYSGTLSLEDRGDSDGTFYYGFDGIRVTASCLKRHSVKSCARRVSW